MMFNQIGKSGTGIEKSGTGIEKSGTGIEKSGTGIGVGHLFILVALCGFLFSSVALAEARLLITERQDGLVFSMHHSEGILAGFGPAAQEGDSYVVIPLYSLLQFTNSQVPQVVGSGSGKEVVGSGSGKEVVGSGSGKEVVGSGSGKDVVGSGSGGAGEQCLISGSLLVVGSGSGKEVVGSGSGKEVVGSGSGKEVVGSGSGKDVVGSGSGASGEQAGACGDMQPWGIAEIAFDADGASVVVHQFSEAGAREHVVAFLPFGAASATDGTGERGFVLSP